MKLTEIKYKNTTTKVIFKKIDDYEIFHIIMALNDFEVARHGEEKVATLTEQYYTVLKSNPILKNLIVRCLKDK